MVCQDVILAPTSQGSAGRAPLHNPRRRDSSFHAEMLDALPHLRAFAISLTNSRDRADDLVQDTLVRALSHRDQFAPGTNLQAWLFTILRNQFHSDCRKHKREVEDPDERMANRLAIPPQQQAPLDFQDLRSALAKLPPQQREALLLIGAEGLTYEEAAQICGTAVGTMKSRINRARIRLARLLGMTGREDFGHDRIFEATPPLYAHPS